MRRTLNASLHFYGRFAAISNLVSLIAALLLFTNGMGMLGPMLLLKLGLLATFVFLTIRGAGAGMYFYYNRQVSARRLILIATALDLFIFSLLAVAVL